MDHVILIRPTDQKKIWDSDQFKIKFLRPRSDHSSKKLDGDHLAPEKLLFIMINKYLILYKKYCNYIYLYQGCDGFRNSVVFGCSVFRVPYFGKNTELWSMWLSGKILRLSQGSQNIPHCGKIPTFLLIFKSSHIQLFLGKCQKIVKFFPIGQKNS
jgi:hypothetical protein